MLSWIFRHRARLRVIYGLTPPPALPQEASAAAGPPPEAAPRTGQPVRGSSLAPGQWARRARYVVFVPPGANPS